MNGNEKSTGILLGAIIGDALCSPLEGLSPGHLRSTLGRITGYMDPEPALRGKLDRWKKPALYTSLSQMALIVIMAGKTARGLDTERLMEILRESPPVEGSAIGIFRHPGRAERALLERASGGKADIVSISCARTAAIIAPAAAVADLREGGAPRGLDAALLFNRDLPSVTAALVFVEILRNLLPEDGFPVPGRLFDLAVAAAESVAARIDTQSDLVLEAGANPETLLRSTGDFRELFGELGRRRGRDDVVPIICAAVNRHLKSPVTRATVDNPLALVPYALALCGDHHAAAGEIPFAAANEGGACGILGSLCGALAGAAAGTSWIPDELIEGLVNRRRLLDFVEALVRGRDTEEKSREFLAAEAPLTRKEIEEYIARNRHRPITAKKKTTRKDAERDLSRHVVESWTKVDRARWKKEKRRAEDGD
jgi:hypothetical protein